MTVDEMIAAGRVVAQQQLAVDRTEEDRLIMAYLAGITAGSSMVGATLIAQLVITQSKIN